jgi:hypothetical protein
VSARADLQRDGNRSSSGIFVERTSIDGALLVGLPVLGNIVGEGIVGVGGAEQGLNAQQNRANLKRGAPLVLENVEADPAEPVDVGVVDPRQESHLGGAAAATMEEG